MKAQKSMNIKFSFDDKMLINQMLNFVNGEFHSSGVCDELDCDYCPFRGLCDYNNAEQIEYKINEVLSE